MFYDYTVTYWDAKKYVVAVTLGWLVQKHEDLVCFLSSVLDWNSQGYLGRITKIVRWDFDNFGSLMATVCEQAAYWRWAVLGGVCSQQH